MYKSIMAVLRELARFVPEELQPRVEELGWGRLPGYHACRVAESVRGVHADGAERPPEVYQPVHRPAYPGMPGRGIPDRCSRQRQKLQATAKGSYRTRPK